MNIRDDGTTKWLGLDSPRGDGEFLRFEDPVYGFRAATRIFRSYRNRGLVTVEQIVSTWAPTTENNVDAYVQSVTKRTGFQAGHVVAESEGDFVPLMQAMAIHETGALFANHSDFRVEVIQKGVSLA